MEKGFSSEYKPFSRASNNESVWNDINISIVPTLGGAAVPATIAFNGSTRLKCLAFSGTNPTPDELPSSLEVLHGYKEGSSIRLHIHGYATTATVANVKLQLAYTWFNRDSVPPAETVVSQTFATLGTAWQEQTTTFIIAPAGQKMGSRFVFSLFRDSQDVADTYAAPYAFTDVGIHYEDDSVGSRQIGVK